MIGVLTAVVDGFPERSHKLANSTSTSPIEIGARLSDHSVSIPEEVILTGLVSDLNVDGVNRAANAWERIREISRENEPIELTTSWGFYSEMLITEVTADERGAGMRFIMKVKEILRVGVSENTLESNFTSGPAEERSSNVERGLVASRQMDESQLLSGTGADLSVSPFLPPRQQDEAQLLSG